MCGPRLVVWRAPIDNDRLGPDPLEPRWRAIGLDRLRHRVRSVERSAEALTVCSRVAPAGTDLGFDVTMTWRAAAEALQLTAEIVPTGVWTVPLPRIGLGMALPATLAHVGWFGRGPGESYLDSRAATRIGRFAAPVDELQTPYVLPQENGARMDVRWATLTDDAGAGLEIGGAPTFVLTARRWTTADLDRARHTSDLVAGEQIHVDLDVAHHGLGSAACGPGVLAQYELPARPVTLSLWLRAVSGAGAASPTRT